VILGFDSIESYVVSFIDPFVLQCDCLFCLLRPQKVVILTVFHGKFCLVSGRIYIEVWCIKD